MTEAERRSAGQPDVSVVMPVWRPRREWLGRAVDSLLAESGCRLELLVVDDGNPTPVSEVLSATDPRVRVLRVPHGGVSRARNAGIAAARGRYVRFLDADDEAEPGSTAHLLELASAHPGAISYGATCFCDEELRDQWVLSSRVQGDAAVRCLLGRFTVRLPSMLFPQEVVAQAGAWDPSMAVSEDWEWILRALEQAHVTGDTEVATRYRRGNSGATSDADAGRSGAHEVVERWLARHPEDRGTRRERRARGMLAAMSARVHLSRGEVRAGVRSLLEAAALDPRALAVEAVQAGPAARGLVTARLRASLQARSGRAG